MSIDVVEVVIWRESSVSGGSGAVQMFLRWQHRKPYRFFFSSRRRHTRSTRDWSSDVCSSDLLLTPMANTSAEPIGSMGTDTPIAVLSDRPRLLFDYFAQLFAQVTNPPLDAIREELDRKSVV